MTYITNCKGCGDPIEPVNIDIVIGEMVGFCQKCKDEYAEEQKKKAILFPPHTREPYKP